MGISVPLCSACYFSQQASLALLGLLSPMQPGLLLQEAACEGRAPGLEEEALLLHIYACKELTSRLLQSL